MSSKWNIEYRNTMTNHLKAKARSSILTHKSVLGLQVRLQSNCITLVQKRSSVCSDPIQKWVYWWASNYASPGLTVLGRRSPAPPAPAQAGYAGGY